MAAADQAASSGAPAARLLEVEEDEVVIDFKPNAKCCADLRLRSLHLSLPVAFKVQTSSLLSTATLRVFLRPQPYALPSLPPSRADRFLVLSSLSAARLNNNDGVSSAVRLRVFFGGPYLLRLTADTGTAAAADVRLILRRQPHLLPLLERRQQATAVPDTEPHCRAPPLPLHAAEVRRLGPDALAACDSDGRTVLHAAAAAGKAEAESCRARGGVLPAPSYLSYCIQHRPQPWPPTAAGCGTTTAAASPGCPTWAAEPTTREPNHHRRRQPPLGGALPAPSCHPVPSRRQKQGRRSLWCEGTDRWGPPVNVTIAPACNTTSTVDTT